MAYPYLGDLVNHWFGTQWNIPLPMFGSFVATALLVAIAVAKKEVMRYETLGIISHAKIHNKKSGRSSEVATHTIIVDLGMITAKDVVLAMSNSGETDEILTIVPLIKRLNVPLIAMTGNPNSSLGKDADVHLDISVEKEACPLGLAPTSSTTATLVMGDALAVALLETRGFTADDFALSHPGGRLGKRLLLHVKDIMHTSETCPKVPETATLSEALVEITRKKLGMTSIVDKEGKLLGIFTDGDLRRVLDHGEVNIKALKISDCMTANCMSITADKLAAEALHIMDSKSINALPVVDEHQRLIGALNMHDLLSAGVV